MIGGKVEQVPDIPYDNIWGLAGKYQFLIVQGTLSTREVTQNIRVMKYF